MLQSSLPVIEARALSKRYGEADALRSVDLEVAAGEVLAVLGPNGAGKTTLLEILGGFREPSGGCVRVLGADPARGGRAWRERVGIVLQESRPEPGLTVRECLELYAGYYAAPRAVGETLALAGLGDRAGARAEQLSGGERRRLDVALAMVGDPDVLFLDEPTTGFDPAARRSAWDVVDGLRALGRTILLTTHHMEEAERLADRIAVLAGGGIVAEGTPGALGGRDERTATISFTLPAAIGIAELPAGLRAHARGPAVTVESADPLAAVQTLAGWARERGVQLTDLDVRRPTLEDVYLSLTAEEQTTCA
jgi:ABC-2 type transport system ATP-binding protein